MKIRQANNEDIFNASKLYREMLLSIYPNREISDLKHFLNVCESWINSPFYYVFVVKDKGVIIGLMVLNIDNNYGLNNDVLNVDGVYIIPKYRNTHVIKLFLNTSVILADELKLNLYTYTMPESTSLSLKMGGNVRAIEVERVFR